MGKGRVGWGLNTVRGLERTPWRLLKDCMTLERAMVHIPC